MAKLWQYAVIRRWKDGSASIVVPPGEWVVAENEEQVKLLAHRAIPEDAIELPDERAGIEVLIRPF